jgi:pantetheine-phosphate adenylyltransferase/dephospho-CoA kinase
MSKQKRAIYPLSGDPVHNGHIQSLATVVNSGFYDEVYFAIGNNPEKECLFSVPERVYLAERAVESAGLDTTKLKVVSFHGFLRDYARANGIDYIIRGARDGKDFEYEKRLADFNSEYDLQTIILPAARGNKNIRSSLVKDFVKDYKFVQNYVCPAVKQALEEKLNGISLVAVTGNMGSGKTTFCRKFVEYSKLNSGLAVSHIDFDRLVHSLYFGDQPINLEIRERIKESFGEDLFDQEELNRRKLAGIVFGDAEKRAELADILRVPSMIKLQETLNGMKGIVLFDAAYLTEYNMLPLVNYNTILIKCDEKERFRRILARDGISQKEVEEKTKAQHPEELKRKIILDAQENVKHGFFYEVDSTKGFDFCGLSKTLAEHFPLLKTEVKENVCAAA